MAARVPRGWPDGVGLQHHTHIDSTNQEALRLARAGDRGPRWIVADTQSAGRGRRGRAWMSEPGNLFCTHLFAPDCTLPRAAQIAFVAALAVYDAVAHMGVADLSLKWPNDLLMGGAKISGILIETAPGPAGHQNAAPLLAIGIGINIMAAPDDTPYPASCLAAQGVTPDAGEVLAVLAQRFDARYHQWECGSGFAGIRADWLARACGVGGPIAVRLHNDVIEGRFETLDESGALKVRCHDRLRTISAGDVFFPAVGVHPNA